MLSIEWQTRRSNPHLWEADRARKKGLRHFAQSLRQALIFLFGFAVTH
jgi:hypothetical protein